MFIKEPEPFASFREDLVFEYSQESSSDLVFEIELEDEEENQEVKKLYDMSEATINIAHVVANKFMTAPSSGVSSLVTPESGYGLVKLWCGEESSAAQYFVAAQAELPEVGVLTSMPMSRIISYGESDEIWIRTHEGALVEIEVKAISEGDVVSTLFEHTTQECGFVRFRLSTEDFGAYTKLVKVIVACDDVVLSEVDYYYIPKVKGAVRIAWIGSYGGVEHYTFPVTNTLTKFKSGVRQYEIESAYEPQWVVDALSEILSSEKIWIVEDGVYSQVEMLSDSVVVNSNGELSTVEYKIERYD